MNVKDLQYELNAMVKTMIAKGLGSPNARFEFNADAQCCCQLTYYDAGKFEAPTSWQNDVVTAFNTQWALIDEIPELAERERQNYLKKVADALEYGRKVGIDDALINPLIEQMQKLSANIIEHKPEPSVSRIENNDDTPF